MEPIIVPPRAVHSASVIWLHGLGDQGGSWTEVTRDFGSTLPHVKWIFPNAPSRPVTLNMGASMPAWADIQGLSPDAEEDEEGTMQSQTMLHALINSEVAAGIAPDRILIGGFSQGAAMAGFAALTFDQTLAGCFMLSGYLTLKGKVPKLVTAASKKTPFWQAHGSSDPVVPFMFGQVSSHIIEQLGVSMEFKTYPIGHTADPAELSDLKAFMLKVAPPAALEPIPDDFETLGAKDLKAILRVRSVDFSDCFEKCDLVAKVRSLL